MARKTGDFVSVMLGRLRGATSRSLQLFLPILSGVPVCIRAELNPMRAPHIKGNPSVGQDMGRNGACGSEKFGGYSVWRSERIAKRG